MGTPVVALTALAIPGDRERCIEAGMNGMPLFWQNLTKLVNYIPKSFTKAQLAAQLDRFLLRNAALSTLLSCEEHHSTPVVRV